MADIAILPLGPGGQAGFDMAMAGPDLQTEDGLLTAVIISLFCDRQANADDVIPDGTDNRRGYWGDEPLTDEDEPDLIGSRMWLLSRCKATNANAVRARDYCLEALQWMIDDGVAQAVNVTTAWVGIDRLNLGIVITRVVNGQAVDKRYDLVWSSTVTPAVPAPAPILPDHPVYEDADGNVFEDNSGNVYET